MRRPGGVRIGWRQALARMGPLSFVLFLTALRAQHRRSLFGYLWLFVPAAAATVTASYVRSRGLLNFVVPDMPYPVFVFAGTMLWQVFLDALNVPLAQLMANRAVVTRLSFPHEGLILSGMWMVLLNTLIRIAALLILCAIVSVPVGANAWLLPLGIGALALLGLAIGLLLAPLGLLYDDIGRGLTIATALLFFVMPIAYPLAGTGWQRYNPVLPLINVSRGWLVGAGSPTDVVLPLVMGAGLLIVSWLFYRVSQPHVIQRLG
jgi:lipopolysaccharide transport system permease protein